MLRGSLITDKGDPQEEWTSIGEVVIPYLRSQWPTASRSALRNVIDKQFPDRGYLTPANRRQTAVGIMAISYIVHTGKRPPTSSRLRLGEIIARAVRATKSPPFGALDRRTPGLPFATNSVRRRKRSASVDLHDRRPSAPSKLANLSKKRHLPLAPKIARESSHGPQATFP
nr:hypothetical protein CFP56_62105 [Quercus suber]